MGALILFAVDGLIILAHLAWGSDYRLFNLGAESNLPTLYQSLKTLAAGVLMILVTRKTTGRVWGIFGGLLLIFFGFDDWFQIHETLSGWCTRIIPNALFPFESRYFWLLIYPPILLLGLVALCRVFQPARRCKLLMVGVTFLTLAFGLEIIESLNPSSRLIFYQITAEESLEMLGITAILLSIIAIKLKTSRIEKGPKDFTPNQHQTDRSRQSRNFRRS